MIAFNKKTRLLSTALAGVFVLGASAASAQTVKIGVPTF